MRAASGVALLLIGALGLRLWGIEHGLPYVFNADENAHFVPRAIGMFGHSLNPGYFINPPAFTYLLHAAFWVRWGGREALGDAFAADPGTVFTLARVLSAVLGAAAVGFLVWAGRRLFDLRVGLVAGALLAVAFLPVHYAHLAVNDVPALAPLCLSLVGIAGVYRSGRLVDYALAGAALGVACATKYTAGIVVLCLIAAARENRLRGLTLAGALALAGFLVANPYALLDWETFRDGLAEQSSASSDGGGKLGLVGESGHLYYLIDADLGARLAAGDRRRRGRRGAGDPRPPDGAGARPGAADLPALHGRPGPLLRPLAAADLPAALPARRLGRGGDRRAPAAGTSVGGGGRRARAVRAGAGVLDPQRRRAGARRHARARPRPGWSRTSPRATAS